MNILSIAGRKEHDSFLLFNLLQPVFHRLRQTCLLCQAFMCIIAVVQGEENAYEGKD